jgi:7-cyano-7-deazaguanine synthase
MDIVTIISGGLDSVTLAYMLHAQGHEQHLIAFDYGQRHKRELETIPYHAKRLGCPFDIIDLTCVGTLMLGSALTDDIPVPVGDYAPENLKVTVVPNRNALFISTAWVIAVTDDLDAVAVGVHSGDHIVYPDCRPEFIAAMQLALRTGTDTNIQLLAPFAHKTKAEIVSIGAEVDVPFDKTWSCYNGRAVHCGQCSTCRERQQSFVLAGVQDPTIYERKPHEKP